MDNEKEIKKSNLRVRIYIVIFISILLLILTSYGYFYVTRNQSDRNRLTGACFNTTFTDGDSISITNAVPMDNTEGLKTSPYHFTLNNTCSTKTKYYVILNVKNNSFDPSFLNVSLNGGYGQNLSTMKTNTLEDTIDTGYGTSYIIKEGIIGQGSVTENIRLWVNDTTSFEQVESNGNSSFTAKIKVVAQVASEYNLATTKIKNIVAGEPTNTTDVITKPAPSGATCTNTLAYDNTTDNNLRYVGANPCNYVSFNDEAITSGSKYYMIYQPDSSVRFGPVETEEECIYLIGTSNHYCSLVSRNYLSGWRIVGVMNNIDDGTGNTETRLKLVRAAEIGIYSYDDQYNPSASGQKYKGINNWPNAALMKELNTDYINPNLTSNTDWRNNSWNAPYYYQYSLNSTAISMIGDTKWPLGGYTTTVNSADTIYGFERGNTVWGSTEGQVCNDDGCPRVTSWVGKIALMYVSDFGYAVGGASRDLCVNQTTVNNYWKNADCLSNDWIYDSSRPSKLAFLSPYSSNGSYNFIQINTGQLGVNSGNGEFGILPTIYLKSTVTITGGSGTPDDPYTLG